MRILKYASDLHIELSNEIDHLKSLWTFEKDPNNIYYLALLGDIGNPLDHKLKLFFEKISPLYEKIFYVPGNHEYYNEDWIQYTKQEMFQKLSEIVSTFENVILMDNTIYQLDEWKIIGSTLWSYIPNYARREIKKSINDYKQIGSDQEKGLYSKYPITIDESNQWNQKSIQWIKDHLDIENPCIILTHHAPLYNDEKLEQYTSRPEFTSSSLSPAFQNALGDMIKPPIKVWLYGHTHHSSCFMYHGIMVATNQLGYSFERKCDSFDPHAYVILENL